MEELWEIISPYIAAAGGATGAGAIIYAIVRTLLNKITQKNTAALNTTFNIDNVAQKVAEKLGGKTLNIDVTAVTEKALKKLSKQLDGKITDIENNTNSYRHLLALIGNALSKLKALTKDEVEELTGAIKAVEGAYTPQETNETMTVVLQPIELADTKDAADAAEAAETGVNFEGLD
jgi:hypothetical protein